MPNRTVSDNNECGKGKLMDLGEAVKRYVRPGMNLHLAAGIGGPGAAICEIIRQFQGTGPEFTIIQSTVAGHALNLVHCNLVKKLICAACADISSSARPSKIIQKALGQNRITLENWSLNSLQQRLMAGAFGVSFMPTRSILGSSIADDNCEGFREMEDPFGSGDRLGMVKALCPDLSIIHGCVSDSEGNLILSAPYGDDIWGPLASKNGVVATVEKIVSTEFIRKYAALVKIPAYVVNAVCVVPLGVHPFSLTNPGISDFEPYEQDIDFLNELHEASLDDRSLDRWITQWVTACATQQEYLNKRGSANVLSLKAQSVDSSTDTASGPSAKYESRKPFNAEEMMLVAIARETRESVRRSGHQMILSGAGSRGIAAWLAYYWLRDEGYPLALVTGNGQIGFTPLPGKSILSSEPGVRSSKLLTDTVMTQGIFVGGRNNKCLSVLGAGQIDRFGNINSTMTATGKFLVGSGGANDALNAREVIVALDQSKTRFAGKLPYMTGPGRHVTTVISTLGIFKKFDPEAELELVACFSTPEPTSLAQRIKNIEENCGWPVVLASPVVEVPLPTDEELKLLRWLLNLSSE
jgi:acyl CoA:acetate/3-ketoacid CoA transferase alpha subunit/acyl CoA:acetate/3-ketoacid CoA transferase beta subunit